MIVINTNLAKLAKLSQAQPAASQQSQPQQKNPDSLGNHLSPEVQQQLEQVDNLLREVSRILTSIKQLNNANGIAQQTVTDHVKPA